MGNSTADLAKKNKGSVASITKVLAIMMVMVMVTRMQMMMNYYHKGDADPVDDELLIIIWMKAVGNFGGSLASITSKEKKNIKSIAKSG